MEADTIMCGQNNRRAARRAQFDRDCCCCRCCCTPVCDCGCAETSAPTATISMADYESFILVPTTVFDQGDVDCGCSNIW